MEPPPFRVGDPSSYSLPQATSSSQVVIPPLDVAAAAARTSSPYDTTVPWSDYGVGRVSGNPNHTILFSSAASLEAATPLTECIAGVGLYDPVSYVFEGRRDGTIAFSLEVRESPPPTSCTLN